MYINLQKNYLRLLSQRITGPSDQDEAKSSARRHSLSLKDDMGKRPVMKVLDFGGTATLTN